MAVLFPTPRSPAKNDDVIAPIWQNASVGCSVGCFIPLESGMDDNYDFLILANNDILIPKDALGELLDTFHNWNSSLVVPTSTEYGVGHNLPQSVSHFYSGIEPDEPDNYQTTQDKILEVKEEMRKYH